MTKRNRNSRRIAALAATGLLAAGAAFGVITSPGPSPTRGAGVSTSPGSLRGAGFSTSPGSRASGGTYAVMQRKAGGGQQDYL
jgi:hypothetical protein